MDVSAPHITLDRTATCKRCGSKTVAWQTSKTGKWYLIEAFTDLNGFDFALRGEFHSKYCDQAGLHNQAQGALTSYLEAKHEEEQNERDRREEENAANAGMNFLRLLDLSEEEQRDYLAALQRECDRFYANPPTMDYMTEFMRENVAQKHRKAEMGFLRAALGELTEEDDDENA